MPITTETPAAAKPLVLSRKNNWTELETAMEEGRLPLEVADTLKSLISCHLHNTIRPGAKGHTLGLLKTHLKGGILLQDEGESDEMLEVGVYVPENIETHRSFFILIPRYPHGTIHRMSELNGSLPF